MQNNLMASQFIRFTLIPLAAVSLTTATAEAQATSYTLAAGYVQVTVPGNSLGAISATLQNKSDHTSNATVNNDWTAGNPSTQTLTVAGAGWTAGQWTSSGYLAYVCDSNGGEEAFLITSNTSDTLTIAAEFNLLAPERNIPTTASISIRLAQTVGGLFGVGANTQFTTADKVYLWDGSGWTTYRVNLAGNWTKIGFFGTVNNDVVFPDEGLFVQRNDAADIVFTFFGDVPGKAQVTTMPGPGLQFVSMRYPVATTIGQLGFETLPGWVKGTSGDLVYLWDGNGWVTYYYTTANTWRKVGGFGTFENDPVAPDSAIFVSRVGTGTPAESANQHALPYTP